MSDFDLFTIELFEQAKRFLEKAKLQKGKSGENAYLNASLLIGVSSLEAHVNAIADEFIETGKNLSILDRSILEEREFNLEKGEFIISNKLKMYRLVERIEFILNKFSKSQSFDKSSDWWRKFKNGLKLRNELVHPKDKCILSFKDVQDSLEGILGLLNFLYKSLYNSGYPAYGRKLDSNQDF